MRGMALEATLISTVIFLARFSSLFISSKGGKEILLTDKTRVRFSKRHFEKFKKLINEQRANELESILKRSNNELLVDDKFFNEYKLTKIEKTVYSKGVGSGAGA